ncbi:hypothetical protein M427DRAFT_124577 [Gonapodya prolifera JEL478]|uniref:Peptidase C14 caspase domain-containing protein n=1 Tax=Gonapodya prolifera (strain JEL478) TaxID=1344416 RepID=A0A139AC80_GONPJ|nr:hypothetical protein M427DRAFT_124577 [Gonapodya prolifera JEL478]|eukprot:KXS14033.1 hypothetical protein M427DRAFT_124577 [Gonapodya prolifera JEL478]
MPGLMDILQAVASSQGGGGGQAQGGLPMGVQQIRPGQGATSSPLDMMFQQLMASQMGGGGQGGGAGGGQGNPLMSMLGGAGGAGGLASMLGGAGGGGGGGGGGLESLLAGVLGGGGGNPGQQEGGGGFPQQQSGYPQQQAAPQVQQQYQQQSAPAPQVNVPPPPTQFDAGGFNFEGGEIGGGAAMMTSKMGYYQSPGKKKALFVGINYIGSSAQLAGCLNDVKNIKSWVLSNYDFEEKNVLTLTDDNQDPRMKPSRRNLTAAMRWLVKDAQRGDSLFFHYSGHGGSTQDTHGDEADGNDETIVPLDYESAGQITDDEIFEIMVKPLPEGCHLTCIFDSCHSGSVMDLPYTYTADGNLDVVQFDNRLPGARDMLRQGVLDRANPNDAVTQLFGGSGAFAGGGPGATAASMSLSPQQIQELVQKRASYGTVIQFAGCADKQTSADASIGGQKTGAASWAFMQVMSKYKTPSYIQMLQEMRTLLKQKYSQVMQMSASQKMNMDQPFTL